MNVALSLIPPKVRLAAYLVYGVAGLLVSSVAVYFTATSSSVPAWVGGAAAVLGSLAAPFGAMAGSNVNKSPEPVDVGPVVAPVLDGPPVAS